MQVTELETSQLKLRLWRPEDYAVFAALNADPAVMEYYPKLLTESESHAFAEKIVARISKRGWGFWAAELKVDKRFIGFVGLNKPEVDLPFNPCVEIGWRLAKEHWGKGYATQAAQAAMAFAFSTLNLDEVVSFTSLQNKRSQAVMQRLGMLDSGENFEHPSIPLDNSLCEHVLYRLSRTRWQKTL